MKPIIAIGVAILALHWIDLSWGEGRIQRNCEADRARRAHQLDRQADLLNWPTGACVR